MRRTATFATLLGASVSIGAIAIRYLMLIWPAEGVDLALVDVRLLLLQYGGVILALTAAALAARGLPDRRRRVLTSGLVAAIGLLLVFSALRGSDEAQTARPSAAGPSQEGPYRFSTDWVKRNTELWARVLGHLKGRPQVHGLEIGAFEGRSAIWFLDNILTHATATITCIDMWGDVSEPRFGEQDEKTFDHNIRTHGEPQKVVKLKGISEEMLPTLPKERFDFIYIDGSHLSRDVLVDAVFSWRLLKNGGVMIFDDYERGELRTHLIRHRSAKMGIDAFLKVFDPYIEILEKDFQVVVQKKTGPVELDTYPRLRGWVVGAQRLVGS